MASSFMPGAPTADRAVVIAAAAAAANEAMLDAALVGVSSGSVLEPRLVDGESVDDNLVAVAVAISNQDKDISAAQQRADYRRRSETSRNCP